METRPLSIRLFLYTAACKCVLFLYERTIFLNVCQDKALPRMDFCVDEKKKKRKKERNQTEKSFRNSLSHRNPENRCSSSFRRCSGMSTFGDGVREDAAHEGGEQPSCVPRLLSLCFSFFFFCYDKTFFVSFFSTYLIFLLQPLIYLTFISALRHEFVVVAL